MGDCCISVYQPYHISNVTYMQRKMASALHISQATPSPNKVSPCCRLQRHSMYDIFLFTRVVYRHGVFLQFLTFAKCENEYQIFCEKAKNAKLQNQNIICTKICVKVAKIALKIFIWNIFQKISILGEFPGYLEYIWRNLKTYNLCFYHI